MQQEMFAEPDTFSGKTSQAHSRATTEGTLLSWLARWLGPSSVFRQENGKTPELLLAKTDSSNGAAWTLNLPEHNHTLVPSHSGGGVCSLSSILETGPIDPPVLLEPESLRGDLAPRRTQGEVAPTIPARSLGGGGLGTDFDCDGGVIPAICPALKARDYKGPSSDGDGDGDGACLLPVAHSLRAEGFDASEDGTGRGTPLVPVAFHNRQDPDVSGPVTHPLGAKDNGMAVAFDTTQVTSKHNYSNPKPGDPCHPLASSAHPPAVAFSCKDHGADAGEIAPTLRSMNFDASHANGGGQVAVAFQPRFARNDRGAPSEVAYPLTAEAGKTGKGDSAQCVAFTASDQANSFAWERDVYPTLQAHPQSETSNIQQGVRQGMQVRRLTPRECERLQGFPDDYTLIPFRNKPAADGNRYKALGNSMACNVMRWIGERIQAVAS